MHSQTLALLLGTLIIIVSDAASWAWDMITRPLVKLCCAAVVSDGRRALMPRPHLLVTQVEPPQGPGADRDSDDDDDISSDDSADEDSDYTGDGDDEEPTAVRQCKVC